jgi:hypothetical protein
MSQIFKFALGDQVKDTITDFKGVIVARTEWMNKCVRYAVQPREMHEHKIVEDKWFDEEQIVLQGPKGKPLSNLAPKSIPTGGPKPAPKAFGH